MLCAIDFSNLHSILRSLYDEMMPLCGDMAGVAQGIAGLGALFFVAYRIWQALARAEPIDVFPLLRPFVIGFCIMFFPTVVLGTINSVMSPIVQGTASMLEGQTLDMKKYREEKDRLEYEQMMNDPSTAYLVDDAEFDRQIDELGVTEIGTAAGMYIERYVQSEKGNPEFLQGIIGDALSGCLAHDRHDKDILPDSVGDTRTDFLCHISLGRIPKHSRPMDMPLHSDISVATGRGFVLHNPCENPSPDVAERHFGTD